MHQLPPGRAGGGGAPPQTPLHAPHAHTPATLAWERRRASHVAAADAGKGFGAKRAPPPQPKKEKRKTMTITGEGDEAVQQALRATEGARKARPIDGREAAQGRVDYANVKDWGSGQPKELGNLQLESFRTGSQAPDKETSFYVQLTFAVVQAEEQGLVSQHLHTKLPVTGRENLPEYERWSFRRERYVQYLADQRAAHRALEQGVVDALAANRESGVAAALDCFSEARGLERSKAMSDDLAALGAAAAGAAPPAGDGGAGAPGPSPAALAYVKYLGRLARDSAQGASERAREEACAKLVAHAYGNHMLLLTKGSMMGAKAAERLRLFEAQAIHTYRSYPFDVIGKDPLKALQRNVNAAGELLTPAQREAVVAELPRAVAHGIQLWEALAHAD